jgi:putative toxin-antitoxin system antitoxin component (TIGR02293 family)
MSCKFGKMFFMGLKKKKPIDAAKAKNPKSIILAEEPAAYYTVGIGPSSFLGLPVSPIHQPEERLSLIRKGLKRGALDSLMAKSGLDIYEMAYILEVTDRTLRRYEEDEILNKRLSERAVEIAMLYSRGEEVFGDRNSFHHWMQAEVPALGHCIPKSFLDTSLGIQMLFDELGRIEHGVFA